MGQLPQSRVTQSRPFLHSGVDYAGPFSIRASRGREAKSCKGYIIIFICFTTSAVHPELVSDYTTKAFIAAYKRFTSRRGICASIASDCGTNLVGADSELRRLLAASSKEFSEIANILASHGTQWRFNPPFAPHFGGKWEAGVKSVKFHLKRVIGEATQTFEQFATFLTQVEATLNSRPLCAISDDPRDPSALTPGHFLVGSALNTIPEPSLIEVPVQRLSHWQHSRQMLEHFWKRWSTEYLQSFQNLSKWQTHHGNIKIGSIVLVKNENLPSSVWPLAKVIEVHPGTDGLVRVVTVKTKSSVLKRPIVKFAGDDDHEFQQNLTGEHHHLESSPSPTDVENEEEGNDDDVDEERVEFADDFDGCEDVHVRFRLLLDEINQIHQMLVDIDRADDDGYYSDEDCDDDDGDEWVIVDWGEDEEAEAEIVMGFSEATR
ncbi:uncharacterized protein [Neodiprion pinetum]|uniref:uncharacterized protein n=1 Tax=Neodiprion pinetum TaxID=441929 RepID=UPI001EDE549C|nr:uncharacterized protein LOC124223670 [Neodiprion pinetum]